ncbi:MAG: hypothetical protein K9J42_01730 [Sulfuritalea sp.]|nr:hypothetical protein [Sulfuritalea sp.]
MSPPEKIRSNLPVVPMTLAELEKVRASCKAMVRRRAASSGGLALIPIPGADIAGDIGLLLELIPAINRKFGLSLEQIEELELGHRVVIYALVRKSGAMMVGQTITRKLIVSALQKVAVRMGAKQVLKYIPFAGQAAAVALSVSAMMYLGNSHVDACFEIASGAIKKQKT